MGDQTKRIAETYTWVISVCTNRCRKIYRGPNKNKDDSFWSLLRDVAQQQDKTDASQKADDNGVSPSSRLYHAQEVVDTRHGAENSRHSSVDPGDSRSLTTEVGSGLVCLSVEWGYEFTWSTRGCRDGGEVYTL